MTTMLRMIPTTAQEMLTGCDQASKNAFTKSQVSEPTMEKSQGDDPLVNDPLARVDSVPTRMLLGTCLAWEILTVVDDSFNGECIILLLKILKLD